MSRREPGFSLIEVMLALGIISFVGLVLLGLFSVGLNANRESMEEVQATHVAQSLLAGRRAVPTGALAGSPLPALDAAASVKKAQAIPLDDDGRVVGIASAKFGMIYRITPKPGQDVSDVYVCLFWPAQAASQPQGLVEMFTVVPLKP